MNEDCSCKRSKVLCSSCHCYSCPNCVKYDEIDENDEDFCKDCGTIFHFYESRCCVCRKKFKDRDVQLECSICQESHHYSCTGLTACQTIYGECKNCFDFKCISCEADIQRDVIYLEDERPTAHCNLCRKKLDEYFLIKK